LIQGFSLGSGGFSFPRILLCPFVFDIDAIGVSGVFAFSGSPDHADEVSFGVSGGEVGHGEPVVGGHADLEGLELGEGPEEK
jgi:hypothetical protein